MSGYRQMNETYRNRRHNGIHEFATEERPSAWALHTSTMPVHGVSRTPTTFTLTAIDCPLATRLLHLEAYNHGDIGVIGYKMKLAITRLKAEAEERADKLDACALLYRECWLRLHVCVLQTMWSPRAREEKQQRLVILRALDTAGREYAMDLAVARQADEHLCVSY